MTANFASIILGGGLALSAWLSSAILAAGEMPAAGRCVIAGVAGLVMVAGAGVAGYGSRCMVEWYTTEEDE